MVISQKSIEIHGYYSYISIHVAFSAAQGGPAGEPRRRWRLPKSCAAVAKMVRIRGATTTVAPAAPLEGQLDVSVI